MHSIRDAYLAICVILGLAHPAAADEIVFKADPWCPYNCEPGSNNPGFMIEIAREALALHGHTVIYENAPWTRALEMARTGEIAGAIGAIPDEAPELLYGAPLGTYLDAVAVRSGENIDPATPATFSGWRVGVIAGYEYYGPIAAYIEANQDDQSIVQHASGNAPLQNNLRKLQAGRVDMVADAHAVLAYTISQSGMDYGIRIVPTSDEDDIYIGFSPALPAAPTYMAQLDEGIATLRANGRLAEILAKYGLSDWAD